MPKKGESSMVKLMVDLGQKTPIEHQLSMENSITHKIKYTKRKRGSLSVDMLLIASVFDPKLKEYKIFGIKRGKIEVNSPPSEIKIINPTSPTFDSLNFILKVW